jgi:hypothetical protein
MPPAAKVKLIVVSENAVSMYKLAIYIEKQQQVSAGV